MKQTIHRRENAVKKAVLILNNEAGGVVIVAVLMLMAVLTILVLSLSTTSNTEIHIAGNTVRNKMAFYAAESGWQDGAFWLDDRGTAPGNVVGDIAATDDFIDNNGDGATDETGETAEVVRGFGNTVDPDELEFSFAIAADRTLDGVPYWYRATYLTDTKKVSENPAKFRNFFYTLKSVAGVPGAGSAGSRTKTIAVNVSKVYPSGYVH